jgi:two-component system, OmpR family, sensor histidine kinase KdpD
VNRLRSPDVSFSDDDRDELLATAEESLDRLGRLVANLLDMRRLRAGVLGVAATDIGIEEAIPRALDELGEADRSVRLRLPDDLPTVGADSALLERVLVDVIGNALRYSPPSRPPTIAASERAGHVEVRVIDSGPGIPENAHEQVFLPFQRLGDGDNDTGVGLGLALSRGLAEAMRGSLVADTTPGGGLTMVLALPTIQPPVADGDATATAPQIQHCTGSWDEAAVCRTAWRRRQWGGSCRAACEMVVVLPAPFTMKPTMSLPRLLIYRSMRPAVPLKLPATSTTPAIGLV